MNSASNDVSLKIRNIVSISASAILALILLIAGTGKLFGVGQMPGQTEFLDRFMPDFLLTPETARFIGEIFIPYMLPVIETVMAILLLAGLWPRLLALIVLPLTLGFMANNIYAIGQGTDKFPDCLCFGVWETLTGTRFTPTQSLYIDIGLFVLALIIIFVHPGRFLSSQLWFTGKKHSGDSQSAEDESLS